MFANTPVRHLYQPRVEKCWDCGVDKVAIAYQAKTLYGRTHYRWLCQECGQSRWVFPTLILLARIEEHKEKPLKKSPKKTNVIASPLALPHSQRGHEALISTPMSA